MFIMICKGNKVTLVAFVITIL